MHQLLVQEPGVELDAVQVRGLVGEVAAVEEGVVVVSRRYVNFV